MGTRGVTEDEAKVLDEHLIKDHKIREIAILSLQLVDLPYVSFICEHDYAMVVCIFCNKILLLGVAFEQLDKPSCSCVKDISESKNAQ